MSSLECPVVPAGTAFSLTAATPASVDSSGALTFDANVHRFCGHCRELCLLCSCEGDASAGRDCIFCNLPPPPSQITSTQTHTDTLKNADLEPGPEKHAHLLLRWASLVHASQALQLDANLFLQREGEGLVAILRSEGHRLLSMVEQLIVTLPTLEQLPVLVNALGFFPQQNQYPQLQGTQEEHCAALEHEARTAAQAYLSGDWGTLTRLGLMLLNSAFLNSDPEQFPPDDQGLAGLYQGLKLLMKVGGDAFSDGGVRYCLDMERSASIAEKCFRERRAAVSGQIEKPLPCDEQSIQPPVPPPAVPTGPVLCKPCI